MKDLSFGSIQIFYSFGTSQVSCKADPLCTSTYICPVAGSVGDSITLTTVGADTTTISNNEVVMGSAPCTITAATATEVTCTLTEGQLGEHQVVFR